MSDAMTPADSIRFAATVFKVQTLIDGGLRLTLDIGQIDPAVIVALFDAKQPGIILECAAVAIRAESLTKLDKNENNETQPKDGSLKLDRGRFIQRGD